MDFTGLHNAIVSFAVAFAKNPANDLECDGAIQRFEYTLELSWKVGGKALGNLGINVFSPRLIIRQLARMDWISDPELWLEA